MKPRSHNKLNTKFSAKVVRSDATGLRNARFWCSAPRGELPNEAAAAHRMTKSRFSRCTSAAPVQSAVSRCEKLLPVSSERVRVPLSGVVTGRST